MGRLRLPLLIRKVNQAISVSTRRTSQTIAFTLGMPPGLILASAVVYLLGLLLPVTAPMAFIFVVSITAVVSILFTRLPVLKVLTTEENRITDRAQEIYEAIMEPLQREAQQMRSRGVPEADIEKFLAPARNEALAIYLGELSKIRGAERLARHLPSAREDKALGPGDPP